MKQKISGRKETARKGVAGGTRVEVRTEVYCETVELYVVSI